MQNPTQRDLAKLLGRQKQQLEALIRDKDRHVKRQTKPIGSKIRSLAVPTGRLRTIHERLKYHLNKISQPEYLFSPRKGRAQRDNAAHHAKQIQFLSLDIRQFYPSTTSEHIFRWAHHRAGMRSDVAGLFAKLVAIDGKMPFGSPVSPVLTTLVHRDMFDEIFAICEAHALKMSVWVDDLTISGTFVKGELVEKVRDIIRSKGFQTHKIRFRLSSRPVIITGVPISQGKVTAPRSLHQRIENEYKKLRSSQSEIERENTIDRLLSALGTYRYHVGASTPEGRKASNKIHALRRHRSSLVPYAVTGPDLAISAGISTADSSSSEVPWD